MLLKHLALRVVADDARVDEAAKVELLGPEHRHLGLVFEGGLSAFGCGSGRPLTQRSITAMGKDFGTGRRLFRFDESANGYHVPHTADLAFVGYRDLGPFRP